MKEIRLTPVPTVRVPSDQASKRTLQRRNASAKQALSQISGESSSAQSTQTTSLIKSLDESQRESITKSLGHEIMIPPSHVASLKSNLLIPWNMMRDISRWLKTFNVTLSSEKRVRAVATDWVGDGLKSEFVPLTNMHFVCNVCSMKAIKKKNRKCNISVLLQKSSNKLYNLR